MISDFQHIKRLVEEANKYATKPIRLFVIGGAMMLYNGLKIATKDVDIIVESKKEFIEFEKALKKMGFLPKMPEMGYSKTELSQILVKGDMRIDLFEKTVCRGFSLSESMKKRVIEIFGLENVALLMCSVEDVFMFKTFTEREGDINDCVLLAGRGIDWNVMLEEIKSQIKASGNRVWITYVGERFDLLEDRGLFIPIINQINKLREEYYNNLLKRGR